MTVAAVRTSVAAIVAALTTFGGVQNVHEEEPWGRRDDSQADAAQGRLYAGRVHFWHVRVTTQAIGGGLGYDEPVRRVRVEGFIQQDEEPPDGIASDVLAANLQGAVAAALSPKLATLDVESVLPDPEIPLVDVPVGDRSVSCHRIGLTVAVREVT